MSRGGMTSRTEKDRVSSLKLAREMRRQVLARIRKRRRRKGEQKLSIPAAVLIREDRDR